MQPDQLLPFQRRFLKGALAPGVDVAALSIPPREWEKLSGGAYHRKGLNSRR